jgi:uncharacterized protein YcfL
MKKLLILCPIALFFIAGCASNNNLRPSDITITDVNRGAFNVDWKATTPDGTTYDCNADDMVRRVNCVK